VIGVYLLYLLPYVGISYYERYAVPLVGVKVLLVVWAVDRCLAFRKSCFRPSECLGSIPEREILSHHAHS
jgi:hypothetical protein